MTQPRHDRLENLWRTEVPYLLRHADLLTVAERFFLEEILSAVTISDEQRGCLMDIHAKVERVGYRWHAPWMPPEQGEMRFD
jgi:hypothetical protein